MSSEEMKCILTDKKFLNITTKGYSWWNYIYELSEYELVYLMPLGGERGGSVVECRTPKREVGGFEPYRRRVVSLSKTLYSPKVLVNYPGRGGSVPTWLKNCWLGR